MRNAATDPQAMGMADRRRISWALDDQGLDDPDAAEAFTGKVGGNRACLLGMFGHGGFAQKRPHREGAGCRMMSSQRWILSFNLVMAGLLLLIAGLCIRMWLHPWMLLFPIRLSDFPVVVAVIYVPIQVLMYIIGVLATCLWRRIILRIYYVAMVVSVITDIFLVVIWVIKMRYIHVDMQSHLTTEWRQQVRTRDTDYCRLWLSVENELQCCGVNGERQVQLGFVEFNATLDTYCDGVFTPMGERIESGCDFSSAGGATQGCKFPLLTWFHHESDLLSVLGYCMVLIMKIIFVFILRHEMQELFVDMFNGRYKDVFRHWAIDDDDQVQVISPGGLDLDQDYTAVNQLTVAEVMSKRPSLPTISDMSPPGQIPKKSLSMKMPSKRSHSVQQQPTVIFIDPSDDERHRSNSADDALGVRADSGRFHLEPVKEDPLQSKKHSR